MAHDVVSTQLGFVLEGGESDHDDENAENTPCRWELVQTQKLNRVSDNGRVLDTKWRNREVIATLSATDLEHLIIDGISALASAAHTYDRNLAYQQHS